MILVGLVAHLEKRTANLQEHKAHLGDNEGINLAVSLSHLLFTAHDVFIGLQCKYAALTSSEFADGLHDPYVV